MSSDSSDNEDFSEEERQDDDQAKRPVEKEFERESDDEDDDAPFEVKNVDSGQNDQDESDPAGKLKSSRRRRKNRGASATEVPEDDVFEQAKLARLEREKEAAATVNRVTDLGSEEDEDEEGEAGVSGERRVQYVVASQERAMKARADDGAFTFAKGAMNQVKRVKYLKQATQKVRRPAPNFTKAKSGF